MHSPRPGMFLRLRPLHSGCRGAALVPLVLLALLPTGCRLPQAGPVAGEPRTALAGPPPLLLISIDGFRHDYRGRAHTPALDRLAAEGLVADALVPVYPSKTFPSHYSIVTGLRPESTGLVANSMWDPQRRQRFTLRNRDAVGDGFWYGGEPIWITAQRQGLRSAPYDWPGSEAEIGGRRPDDWEPYDDDRSYRERIERILALYDRPPAQRPHFATLYFSGVDGAGHRHGPDSPQVTSAVEAVDRSLQRLLAGLEERGLLGRMHILVVSDHGMAATAPDRLILLDDYLDVDDVHASDWGPAVHLWEGRLDRAAILVALEGAHPHLRAWPRDEIPERYHFRHHRRIPDVLVEADLGWLISSREYVERFAGEDFPGGSHGWDPAHPEMQGIFLAHGPAFRAGDRMGRVQALDLYALMAQLLAIRPAPHEGDAAAFTNHLPGRAP